MTLWLVLVSGLWAHEGGVLSPSNFQVPADVGEVADQAYLVRWLDNDTDPTGVFEFYFQPANVPPQWFLTSPLFLHQGIPGGGAIRVDDRTNQLSWDTSGVPEGSYFVYSITRDPPLDPIYTFSPFPVTVKHSGTPAAPAVVVDEPDGVGDIAAARYATKWHASGEGVLTATVRGYKFPPDMVPIPLVTDLPMVARNGRQEGCFDWDVEAADEGYYFTEVEVKDGRGRTHRAYSPLFLVVYREPGMDAGVPAPGCQGFPQMPPDAGPNMGDDEDGGCSCDLTHARGTSPWIAFLLVVVGFLALRRR
jgi:MYXO-CTERM domain-containing protein